MGRKSAKVQLHDCFTNRLLNSAETCSNLPNRDDYVCLNLPERFPRKWLILRVYLGESPVREGFEPSVPFRGTAL